MRAAETVDDIVDDLEIPDDVELEGDGIEDEAIDS
jgi:hypothetical protein